VTSAADNAAGVLTSTALPHKQVLRIVLGMQLAVFLAAMDQTIVAVALLAIGRDLQDFSLAPWVVAGYLIATTVATPIYGNLSDALGRKPLILWSVIMYVIMALGCALAQSMPQLILFRVLQGLGSGGLLSLSQSVVADIAPGPSRGRYQGYLAGTFATAAVFGPLLGGFLTYYLSWRAIFWISLPLGLIGFFVARWAMRDLAFTPRPRRLDYPGILLLAGALICVMVALTLVGQGHSLLGLETFGLLAASGVLFMLLAGQERRSAHPLLPPALFVNSVSVISCLIPALLFFVMIGSTVLLPMAMQSVARIDADAVALRMLPLTLAIPSGAFMGGRFMYKTGRYRESILLGSTLATLALVAIAFLGVEAAFRTGVLMSMMGVGIGMSMPSTLVAAQMSVPRHLIGSMTSVAALSRTLGAAVGITVLTAILFVQLGDLASTGTAISKGTAPQPLLDTLMGAPADTLRGAFQMAFGAASLCTFTSLLLALKLPRELSRVAG
jgi:EmrB/QacA subfamily drug resistance transporter